MDLYKNQIAKTECLINGKKLNYDGCSKESLKEAKAFYKDIKIPIYIGSGYIYFVNNVRNVSKKKMHFFIRE